MIPPLSDALAALAGRPDVAGALVISDEGLVVASAMPPELETEAVAALAATSQSALDALARSLRHSPLTQSVIDGPDGSVILARLSPGTTLLVLAASEGDLGELLFAMREALPTLSGLV